MSRYCRKHELYMEKGSCPLCAIDEIEANKLRDLKDETDSILSMIETNIYGSKLHEYGHKAYWHIDKLQKIINGLHR